MKQLGLGLNLSTKRTRKREFLDEIERVVLWAALVQVAELELPAAFPLPRVDGEHRDLQGTK